MQRRIAEVPSSNKARDASRINVSRFSLLSEGLLICKMPDTAYAYFGKERSPEQDAEIRERFAYGKSQRALSDAYHIPLKEIQVICDGAKRHFQVRRGHPHSAEARALEGGIRMLYAGGKTEKEISSGTGVSQDRVHLICEGVERKK